MKERDKEMFAREEERGSCKKFAVNNRLREGLKKRK